MIRVVPELNVIAGQTASSAVWTGALHVEMQTTRYFADIRRRPDRASIAEAWIARVVAQPEHERAQSDGRLRRWGRVPEAGNRWLRVVVLEDGVTVHNAFFDRRFQP